MQFLLRAHGFGVGTDGIVGDHTRPGPATTDGVRVGDSSIAT